MQLEQIIERHRLSRRNSSQSTIDDMWRERGSATALALICLLASRRRPGCIAVPARLTPRKQRNELSSSTKRF